ncbi:MAG: M16 family metallopeptidase [Bacteroidota bacterium]
MKNTRSLFTVLFCLLLLLVQTPILAQDQTTIPLNPNIKYGKLKNGLTYYIMKNTEPKDKVELRLAVNAGSIQEDDNQLGLAHFMEHMNFNGTKNFEKNELVDYLQSVGVKFGAHLNAYTSFDETVYMLTLPTEDPNVLDTGFQVLEDWAHNASLTDEEIDKERGVVLEEYRLGLGASERMRKNYLPKLLYNSRYANRIPIGTEDILKNFEHKTIRKFYQDWYRPDLMAVIIVGDIDPAAMEEKVKAHFSKIKNPKKERPREVYDVPNHKETFISVENDPEYPYSLVQLIYKDPKPAQDVTTVAGYKKMLTIQMFSSMFNNRLDEIRNSANPPFSYAGGDYGSFAARTKNAFQMYAVTSETGQLKGLETLLTEAQRIKYHGFTKPELDRVKLSMLAFIERAYNERDKSQSTSFADEFVRNFLQHEPAPGITWEFEEYKKLVPTITIEDVNALINSFISDENRVVIFLSPQKAGLEKVPEARIREVLDQMDEVQPAPYEEEEIATTLIEDIPQPGKIVNTEVNKEQDFTTITLENGMQVSYKITDFKNDQIVLRGYSYGGTSTFTDDEFLKTHLALDVAFNSGIGDFSEVDLKKALSGKVVGLSPSINTSDETISGGSTPKDLETLFQLLRLYFTSPRKDQDAYNSYITRNKAMYANLSSNPQTYYGIEFQKYLTQNDIRSFDIPTEKDWEETDYNLIMKKYKESFANPGDFKLFFVGNIDEDALLNFAKTYLATIPDNGRRDHYVDRGVRMPKGTHEKIYKKGLEQKSYVTISFEGDAKFNKEDQFALGALGDILTIKLTEILREEKSGVYGVGASGRLLVSPYPHFEFSIRFPCGPENAMELKETALAELNKIIQEGPLEKDLDKVKEEKRKSLKESLRTNNYWVSSMYINTYTHSDFSTEDELYQRIDNLSAENIKTVGKKYLTGDYIVGILMPEDK